MLIIMALFVFTVTMTVLFIGYNLLMADKRVINRRLARYVDRSAAPANLEIDSLSENKRQQRSGLRSLIRTVSQYVEQPQLTRWFEHRLVQAGIPMRGSEFLVICGGLAALAALFLSFLSGNLLFGLVGAVGGFVGPVLFLRIKIDRRTAAFNNQLGDALVLIANSLRTGYSFMQAVEMVSREMPRPIGDEFARVLKEMNLGVATEEAMNNLAKRVNSDDLDLVITAVLIQRQVGGNLAEVLDNIAGTIRERVKIKGKIKTLTAQGRISGIIIGLLPIAVGFVIYLINPEYIKVLFSHPTGRAMLAAGVVSQLLGMVIIRKIINIEV